MIPNKAAKEKDKLEKDLKTLVSKMKNENSALMKILVKLKPETDLPEVKTITNKTKKKTK